MRLSSVAEAELYLWIADSIMRHVEGSCDRLQYSCSVGGPIGRLGGIATRTRTAFADTFLWALFDMAGVVASRTSSRESIVATNVNRVFMGFVPSWGVKQKEFATQ